MAFPESVEEWQPAVLVVVSKALHKPEPVKKTAMATLGIVGLAGQGFGLRVLICVYEFLC